MAEDENLVGESPLLEAENGLEGQQKEEKLGERLVRQGVITQAQLGESLGKQRETGRYLGEILITEGYATVEEVYQTLSEQIGLVYVDLATETVDFGATQLIPEKLARRFHLIPIAIDGDVLTVAVADHLDVVALDIVANNTGCRVRPVLSSRQSIQSAIDQFYGRVGALEDDLQAILETEEREKEEVEPSVAQLEVGAHDAPVVRFVNLLIRESVRKRASDLHIEPRRDSVSVRARVDGRLRRLTAPTKAMFPAVVTRIKILAGMDIGERRLPQDGRFRVVEDKNIDIRVSTLPTIHGEKVVLRLLDKSKLLLKLSSLGFEEEQRDLFNWALTRPQGVVLVTGPTGSGKTTTLYSGLASISREDQNVITIEDPVEYELEGVNQIQVRAAIGLTFAQGLRSILRQDPDVVMVGEIRDLETAEIAVRAALTGHLVLSTIHTNSAVATITRLADMGVKPFLLGSCLTLILAQRLVRRICDSCKRPYEPPKEMLETLGIPETAECVHGAGCARCDGTGYYGRVGLYEMLPIDVDLSKLITQGVSEEQLEEAARQAGLITLRECGVKKILTGVTTPEEVIAETME